MSSQRRVHLRLPATSANLGPAFDTAAVALGLYLQITAEPAGEFSTSAQGRDAKACGKVEGNLILETYRQVLAENHRPIQPLYLDVNNAIPLGMGCGSSAAARLAGIALAIQFGELGWQEREILAVATHLEGHPDNVTACWLGGMTVAAVSAVAEAGTGVPRVDVARFDVPEHWQAVVVLPRDPIRTEESRKVLLEQYSRSDVVANLQHCSLLVAAFAQGRNDLLTSALHDRLHEPYRQAICPLLGRLQPFTGSAGLLGVALSGAGPGVLLIVEREADVSGLDHLLERALGPPRNHAEVVHCGFENCGAQCVARSW